MNRKSALIACLCLSVACAGEPVREPVTEAPHLRVQGEASQLIVDGRPFLMLAGELGNSTVWFARIPSVAELSPWPG